MGKVKNTSVAFPGKEGHSRLVPSKLSIPQGGVVRSVIVFKEKGVISSQTFF